MGKLTLDLLKSFSNGGHGGSSLGHSCPLCSCCASTPTNAKNDASTCSGAVEVCRGVCNELRTGCVHSFGRRGLGIATITRLGDAQHSRLSNSQRCSRLFAGSVLGRTDPNATAGSKCHDFNHLTTCLVHTGCSCTNGCLLRMMKHCSNSCHCTPSGH